MSHDDVLKKVQDVIRELFDDSDIIINDETVSADIDGWDSFETINVFVTLEETFGIRFKMKEIPSIQNIGELVDCIISHLSERHHQ